MGGKKPLRRPLWPPTRATASNYYPLGLDGAGGAAKPLLRAPKKPAPLHGRLPAFSGAVDAFERARKCFLEWRYFFSIILSEFLKNRVALQLGALFNHNAMCNLQSDQPIEQIAKAEYIHITNYELRALLSDIYNISEEDELWLEKYYKTAYKLLEKDSFQTAVHTMASYRWHSVPRVQLAVIWSGIESLFNVNTEVSFRISLYIANFLGENEAQAQQIFKQVRKIYSSRSSAVHGNKTKDNLESAVEESANLLTRILRRCAELNKLPDVDNLAFRVDKQKQGIKCKILVP